MASVRGCFGAVVTFAWACALRRALAFSVGETTSVRRSPTLSPAARRSAGSMMMKKRPHRSPTYPSNRTPWTVPWTSQPCRRASRSTGLRDQDTPGSNGTKTTVTPLCPSMSSASNRTRPRGVRLPLRVERAIFDEAEVVAPPVGDVERALSPGALQRLAAGLAVHLVGRQGLELLGPGVHRAQVL